MKAWTRKVYGDPDVLEFVEVDKPVPKTGEVLVRLRATSINASDWEFLTGVPLYGRIGGAFRPKTKILGSDIAGVVEDVGAQATRFRPGEAVYGDVFERWGGFAEWVAVPEKMLRPIPAGMSFEQASAIPQSGTIALQGVEVVGGLRAGERVLINGAGGSAGSFAIQLAKVLGAEVTAVDSALKLEWMRSLGADHVLDYAAEDFTARGPIYDLIFDLAGRGSFLSARRALAPRGRYLLVGGWMTTVFATLIIGSALTLVSRKQMKLLLLQVNQGLGRLERYFESGVVVPAIDRTFPLEKTPEALRLLGQGKAKGKLVITMAGG